MEHAKKIEVALRKLPILPEKEENLPSLIQLLGSFNNIGSGTLPSRYRGLGRVKTKEELDKFVTLAGKMTELLEGLHQPAVMLLADNGLWKLRLEWKNELHSIANMVRKIDVSDIPKIPKRTKPEEKRSQALANTLAYGYRMLTGKEA